MDSKYNKDIQIKDIAEKAGTSVATVSRVINNNGRFSEETRKRVQDVIDELNYSPNPYARSLRTNKTNIIAIIVPNLTNEFYSLFIQRIQMKMRENNYYCCVFSTNESYELEKESIDSIKQLNVCGAVYSNANYDLGKILPDTPIVYIDPQIKKFSNHSKTITITSDHEKGGYLAGEKFAKDGCKNVAVIASYIKPDTARFETARTKGFLRACKEYGIEVKDVYYPNILDQTASYDYLMKSRKKIDGLFCQMDWLAAGALKAAIDKKITVPDELEIIGFDNIRVTEVLSKQITTIEQSKEMIGDLSVSYLLDMIRNKPLPDDHNIIVDVKLICRETTR